MRIQEYFNIQKALRLSEKEKLELYQRILIKNNSRNLLKRRHVFFAKNFIYNFLLTVILVGVFGYILSQNDIIDYGSFLVKTHNPNEVEAGYIGQVLDFKGDFYISHNGELFQSKNISNGDTIILKNNTSLIFDIDKSSKAIIKGPAKLILEKFNKENRYKITLLEGDFIHMESINEKPVQNIELSVEGENILVKQEDKNKPMNFQLVKQGDKHIVKNNGGNLLISKIGANDKPTSQVLNKEQILTIQSNDIEVFENLEQFAEAIKEKNISQIFTFDIQDLQKESGPKTTITMDTQTTENNDLQQPETINNEEDILNSILGKNNPEPENQEISRDIKPIISTDQDNSSSKKVPMETQIQKLRTSLIGSFLLSDLEEIYIYQSLGNQKELDFRLQKLESKTKQLYMTFELTYNGTKNISSIKQSLKTLSLELSQKYYIPPTYLENLYVLSNRLDKIDVIGFGSQTDTDTIKAQRNILKNNPNLIFNNN